MKSSRLHVVAMILFVVGFITSGSGWAPLIAWSVDGRPAWSLCGQEMCSCLPTAPVADTEPQCPLCVSTGDDSTPRAVLADNPKRLPRTEKFDTLADASQAGCSSLFLSLIFAVRAAPIAIAPAKERITIDQDARPSDPTRDLPTPPPRA